MLNRGDKLLREHPVVAKWLLALITVVVFGGMLGNGFVYDDDRQILENPFVHNPHLWQRIFTGPVWSFLGARSESNFYRPLHMFSYWLLWQVAGPNPAVFHLYQLVFHIVSVLLVYRLGRELLPNHVPAFAGALLWALHPLHVEPVCWIAGVPDCGCTLFFLVAFVAFLRGERLPQRRWAWDALGVLALFIALLFKEMAISLPVLLVVYWLVMADGERWWSKGLRWLQYVTAVATYLVARIVFLGHVSETSHLWKISPGVAGAALGLLGRHTQLFFWPTGLNDFRSFDLAGSLRSPWPWITVLTLGLAVCLRRRNRALTFLILWWPVTLLPCLDVRQLSYPLLAERFSYLPSVGLSLAVAYVALHLLPVWLRRHRSDWVLATAFGLMLMILSVQDWRAVPRWHDNDTLWDYSYSVAPQSALVHLHRAFVLQYRAHDLPGATYEYETAIKLNRAAFIELPQATYDSLMGLGEVASLQGRNDQAVEYFVTAIDLAPRNTVSYEIVGFIYFRRGDYARAAAFFEQAARFQTLDRPAHFAFGTCWMKLGKPVQAAEQFHAARELDPGYSQAFEAEVEALEAAGDKTGSARVRAEMALR